MSQATKYEKKRLKEARLKYSEVPRDRDPPEAPLSRIEQSLKEYRDAEARKVAEREAAIRRKFRKGARYEISGEPDYRYEYIGKAGIHHKFREVSGGWSRTYTDAQLVGKTVKEVRI